METERKGKTREKHVKPENQREQENKEKQKTTGKNKKVNTKGKKRAVEHPWAMILLGPWLWVILIQLLVSSYSEATLPVAS